MNGPTRTWNAVVVFTVRTYGATPATLRPTISAHIRLQRAKNLPVSIGSGLTFWLVARGRGRTADLPISESRRRCSAVTAREDMCSDLRHSAAAVALDAVRWIHRANL
jgi:hypothetical protein